MGKSSNIFKTGVFALGLVSFILAPVTGAMADDDYDDGDDYNNYNYNYNYNRHYNNRPYYNRHNYNRHNSYGGGYYRRRGGHGGEVALGILTGGLLFYALTSNNRRSHNNRTVYVQPQPVYARQQPVYSPPVQPRNNYANASCLQVREYQTTITVGNQTVPAYGQSCLQADGTWRLGPAIPEPGN